MEQSTAVSRMSPAAGRVPAFRWALSARRRPGGDKEATVLACAVLDALGVVGEGAASVASDLARATAYVMSHGSADAYRLTIEVDGGQCAVRIDDRDEDDRDEGGGDGCRAVDGPASDGPAARESADGATGQVAADLYGGRLRVQHRTDGTLAVSFRRPFPLVAALAAAGERTGAADVVPLPVVACGLAAEAVATDLVAEG
ncbi:hypothetical protein ABZ840_11045 [Streptomyces sp. NPDC047117]|uniref:hypothetical protein n=1 Tax=Streptomyces sp. NPDC047117 TaxID=3155379 RepID=UPI0033FCC52D